MTKCVLCRIRKPEPESEYCALCVKIARLLLWLNSQPKMWG